MPKKYEVCYADEIPVGGRRIVDIAGRSVGIFNVNNQYFAVRNSCPHKGAPLCRGIIDGMVSGATPGQFEYEQEGEIIRCPWHGWEFAIKTGQSVFNPHQVWVRGYPVSLEVKTSNCAETDAGSADEDPSVDTYRVSVEETNENGRPTLYVYL
ncbi:Rieske (2Fe-2S) protein [Mesorhizobium sp.]|uniref:Rieske (2Fe-2S) protein n=1 Tax=Mesorhizobium sp. TaxID=1871066 RepID=UPI000FE551B1|nr:Rieske (2Fe-2S) protein [Mesorhizobium sp.]RWQ65733.1 MAG: Rieske (2Fe-2S) protein [Mesorhizobium sp.]